LEAVQQDGRALEMCRSRAQGGPGARLGGRAAGIFAVIDRDVPGHLPFRELKADRELVLGAVRQNGRAWQCAVAELKADGELVLEAVRLCGHAWE
jgi:hypothetical protein